MPKILVYATAVILASVCISFGQKSAELQSVTLSTERIYEVCRVGRRSHSGICTPTQALVRVSAEIRGTNMENRSIYYIPSGGKIVGSGQEVTWDLTDARPGIHTISVGIGADDVVKGNVATRTLTVKECDVCDPPCSCPAVSIEGPKGIVRAGDAFLVRAISSGGDDLTYKWTISTGAVVDSVYSRMILVKTTKHDAEKDVTVMLDLGGTDSACNCPTMFSVTVRVQKR